MQLGAEFQTPIHEVALYEQVGMAFSVETETELQFGIRHPIVPWRFHGLPQGTIVMRRRVKQIGSMNLDDAPSHKF